MKRQLAALLLTIFALSLTACGETATESETRTVYAMDTVMNLTVCRAGERGKGIAHVGRSRPLAHGGGQ